MRKERKTKRVLRDGSGEKARRRAKMGVERWLGEGLR